MKKFGDILTGISPPPCKYACDRCSGPIPRPGLCPECADTQRAQRDARVATHASMPERLSWPSGLTDPDLVELVGGAALAQARALDLKRLDRVTLLGPAGVGKSTLAVTLAKAWTSVNARPSVFVAAVDLGVARQQHGLGDGEASLVKRAMGAELAVLDDLGVELEAGAPVVAHVLHHRYDRERPTVATTGLSVEQLAARYGAGVARRLVETAGGAVVVKLIGRRNRETR